MAKIKPAASKSVATTGAATLAVRPYKLLELICLLGGDKGAQESAFVKKLHDAVYDNPDLPLTLVCNASEVFSYQDPGTQCDTPDGPEVNLRRDLEILHKINLFPGATLPARIIFSRVWDFVTDLNGVCCFGKHRGNPWPSWPAARVRAYRRGLQKTSETLFPLRPAQVMAREKEESITAMLQSDAVDVRPHVLLCSVCQYGSGVRPPYAEDNLPELLQHLRQHPATKLRMAAHADWMMCAPCPYRIAATNSCVNNRGSGGLSNQMRDLRVLERLGLKFGDVLPGLEIYRRILERIPGTLEICRLEQGRPSVWWTGCGAATSDNKAYTKGRRQLLKLLFNEPATKSSTAKKRK